mgnify:CR=1 FL=1
MPFQKRAKKKTIWRIHLNKNDKMTGARIGEGNDDRKKQPSNRALCNSISRIFGCNE